MAVSRSIVAAIAMSAIVLSLSVCAASPNHDSCSDWKSQWEAATKSGDTELRRSLLAYVQGAMLFGSASNEIDRRMEILFVGPGTDKNYAAVGDWMLDYCTANKGAMVRDGAQTLAAIIVRTKAVPPVASARRPSGPDLDTCTGWMAAMDAPKPSSQRDRIALDTKVVTELGKYGNAMNDLAWWKNYLFSSQQTVEKDVNGWMRKYCARNPNATIAEGVYVLGPQIRREGGLK
jgi:hypothetical protein